MLGPRIEPKAMAQDLEERMHTDMEAVCSQLSPGVEFITIHGGLDETIPVEDAHNFAARIPGKRIHVIEGADHNYSKPEHAQELISKLVEFFSK